MRELYDVVRTSHVDKQAFNAKLETFVTTRLPESWRPAFESFYPAELRKRHVSVLDLLEADDERLYGAQRNPPFA